jgi:proteasome lid subunit RPN8/RPN11
MVYQIAYAVTRQIADHAQNDYPNEVCGLLVGRGNHIQKAIPITNTSPTPRTAYVLHAGEQLNTLLEIDEDNFDWIGVYHSHPTSPPIASQTDIALATDPSLVHVIISLQHTKPQLKAWRIDAHQAEPIDLIFDTEAPDTTSYAPLSKSQKLSIVLAGVISVLLLLTISFTLLPPAPEITAIP